jgi:alpha-tubulin suppressor-like RCC1 family protein
VGTGGTAVAIAAGWDHTCALLESGGLRCWGSGADGRLGYASTDNIGDDDVPADAADVVYR